MSITKQVSIHGRRLWISDKDQTSAKAGYVAGGDDTPSVAVGFSEGYSQMADDFHGPTLDGKWSSVEGDTGHTQAIAAVVNGVLRMTNSGSAGATPTEVNQVVSALQWKANMGPGGQSGDLKMTCRLKAGTWTMGGVFVGFTDLVTAEMPAYDTGGDLITAAADCVGFLFGENGDTGWMGVSAKSTAGDSGDQQVALTTTAPTANKYVTLEVAVRRGHSDTGGIASFWVDGVAKGTITSPIGSAIALTPTVAVFDVNDTGAPVVDVDYISVSGPRDTGT